jgi:hypothetical protein
MRSNLLVIRTLSVFLGTWVRAVRALPPGRRGASVDSGVTLPV